MYELVIFVVLSIFLECGMGIVYGVGIGYEPLIVFPAAILINFLSIIVAVKVLDRLLEWKKGFRSWLERRLARGQKLIDKYGCAGIVMGVFFPKFYGLSLMLGHISFLTSVTAFMETSSMSSVGSLVVKR